MQETKKQLSRQVWEGLRVHKEYRLMKKALFAILLCMLLCCSCTTDTPDIADADTTVPDTVMTDDTADATDDTYPFPAEADYAGASYTVLACDENVPYTYFELPVEETGDAMNDAIYRRNRATEEYLNITLQLQTGALTEVTQGVVNAVAAGDDTYQLANIHIVEGGATLVSSGALLDLNTIDTLDLAAPWWNTSFASSLTIHRAGEARLYLASGDMIVPNARVIVMNKALFEAVHRDVAIYTEVREGKWTLDRLGTLTAGVLQDTDGNGTMDADDQYAFGDLDNAGVGTSFLHGSGMLLLEMGADGSFSYVFDNDRLLTMMEKLYTSLYQPYTAAKTATISTAEFGEGHVLFGSQVLLKLQVLREYDTDFGILPFPKFDEEQAQYYSSVWNGLLCVPITVSDPSFCGHVMEVLNATSCDTLSPAYYDTLLSSKFSRDPDSTAMLDLIFDGVVYDIGFCFDNWIGLYSLPAQMMLNGNLNLSSYAAANRNVYEAHYTDILGGN